MSPSRGRLKRPQSILTERGFDRRLAAMIAIAFAAHLLILGVSVFLGEFRVRPLTPPEAYTVEVVSDGELGGHLPSGLPKLDLGGAEPPKRVARPIAKAEPPAAPKPPPEPKFEPAQKPDSPPEPAPKPEPPPEPEPPAAPEAVKDEPKPEQPADPKPAEEGDLIVATATPTPRPTAKATVAPTATPTPRPTARPTAKPSARPTARPTSVPSASPRATAVATARPTGVPRASATPQSSAPPARSPKVSPGRSPGAAPRPTISPVVVVKQVPTPERDAAEAGARRSPQPGPTSDADARIAAALERVQRNVGQDQQGGAAAGGGVAQGGVRAPGGDPRGAGGVGGTDAYDPGRRIGMGPGRGGAGDVRGAEFLLYYNQMLARIRDAWVYTGGATTAEVKVRFRIADDGTIGELRVVQPSGDAPYDASVLRAVRGASPLAPPPERYRADFADVELTFQPGDLKTPR